MLYFVTRKNHQFAVKRLATGLKKDFKTIKPITYEQLFRKRRAPIGHYIFTDHDRLSNYECEVAAAIANELRRVDPNIRILNHPADVLERFPLLRLLQKAGLNDFAITRLDDGTLPEQYPVFIRCEDHHMGAETDLLGSEQELKAALVGLKTRGKVLKRRVAVQFFAQQTADGYYRKYGALNFNGTIIPQHILEANHWHAKSASRQRTEANTYEELEYIRSNPHREYLAKVFRMANIEYGRADYGIVNGKVQIYEINTNPQLPPLDKETHIEISPTMKQLRIRRRELIRRAAVDAFRRLDVPLQSRPPIRYRLPQLQYHALPLSLHGNLREKCFTTLRDWEKRNPKLSQRIPMLMWVRSLRKKVKSRFE